MAKSSTESLNLLQNMLAARQRVEAGREKAAIAIVDTFQLDIAPSTIVGGFENKIAVLEVGLHLDRASDDVTTILHRMAFEPNFPSIARGLEDSLGAFLPLRGEPRPEVAAGLSKLVEANYELKRRFNYGTKTVVPLRQTSEQGVLETPDGMLSVLGSRYPALAWQGVEDNYKSGIDAIPSLLDTARRIPDVESLFIDFERVTQPISSWLERFTFMRKVKIDGMLCDSPGLDQQVLDQVLHRADIGRRLTPSLEDQFRKAKKYTHNLPPIADILHGMTLIMAADRHQNNPLRREGLNMFLNVQLRDDRGYSREKSPSKLPVTHWVSIETPADSQVELDALGAGPLTATRSIMLHELSILNREGGILSVEEIWEKLGLNPKKAQVTRDMPDPTDLLRGIPLNL